MNAVQSVRTPPNEVTLVYREVGVTHVFTARDFRGFHIGSADLKKAYNEAIEALGEHVSLIYNCPVYYTVDMPFEDFERLLGGEEGLESSFVVAKRAEQARASVQ